MPSTGGRVWPRERLPASQTEAAAAPLHEARGDRALYGRQHHHVLAITGLAAGPLNPLIFTVVQERTPEHLRGRVIGALWALALAASPLGVVLTGYLLEAVGLRLILVGVAAGYLVVTLSMLFNPALREMDERPRSAEDTATEDATI
jgi:MFS family permease